MNIVDIVVVAVVGILTVAGFWKGMVRQVFGIAGIVAGYVLAMRFYQPWSKVVTGISPGTARVVTFIAIFLACLLVAHLMARGAEKLLAITRLGFFNRIGGGLFGFLKGCILVSVGVLVLTSFFSVKNSFFSDSSTMKYILPVTASLKKITREDIRGKYHEKIGAEEPSRTKHR